MTSMCQICKQNYTEDLIVGVGDNERFNTNETISVVCSNCYEKHQCEGCDDWHTHKNMCEECGECADPSSHHRCCECETWNEECYDCDTPMTEKILTELEFDEYPDRDIGYGKDGEWRCGNCRSNEEDELICGENNGGGCGSKGWKLDSGAIQFGCECGEEDISHLTDKEYISHLEKKVEELEGNLAIEKGEDRCGCGHCGK